MAESATETDLYQDVKRIAESKLGIVTQCIVAQKAGIGTTGATRGL